MFLADIESTIQKKIHTEVPRICSKYHIHALFGGIASNRSRNTDNCFSDVDFLLICAFPKYKEGVLLLKDVCDDIDFFIFDFKFLLKQAMSYETKFHERNRPDDYYDEVIFEILCSKFLYDCEEYVKRNINNVKKALLKKKILNYFYVRAEGNYQNNLSVKTQVPLQKYLLTLHGILVINWIIDFGTLPPYNIDSLTEIFKHKIDSYKEIIEELLMINRAVTLETVQQLEYRSPNLQLKYILQKDGEKTKVFVEPSKELNYYIKCELQKLKVIIQNVKDDDLLDLNHNSILYEYLNAKR